MTNLTEKWKKGELPDGLYWVKHDGVINILDNYEAHLTEVEEVLAEVPSYDELQNMNEAVNECMSANIKLVEQNKQLKELLKECKALLSCLQIDDYDGNGLLILNKINQVLGDKING